MLQLTEQPIGLKDATPGMICVLVLGMHRSGTSATARVLNLLGAKLPEKLNGPAESNLRGHWEPTSIVDLNDEILKAVGSSWDDIGPLNRSALDPNTLRSFRSKALAILSAEYGRSSLFLIKDPRISRLVPFWVDVLTEFGAEPRIALPVRDPVEVAGSLAKRDRMASAYAYRLWARYVLEAERESRSLPRAVFGYQELVQDWRGVVDRVAAKLELQVPTCPARAAAIDDFLSPELRHHSGSIYDPNRVGSVPAFVGKTYEALLELSKDHSNTSFHLFDQLGASLEREHKSALQASRAELLARRHTIDEVKRHLGTEIARLIEEERRLHTEVHARNLRIAELEHGVSDLNSALAGLNSDLAGLSSEAEGLRTALHSAHAEIANVAERLSAEVGRLNTEVHHRNLEIERLNTEVHHRNLEIERLNTEVHHRNLNIERLNSEAATVAELLLQRDALVERLETQVREHRTTNEALQHQVEQLSERSAARERELIDLTRSFSWRVTYPARVVGARVPFLGRGLRRSVRVARSVATLQVLPQLRRWASNTRDARLLRESPLFSPSWYRRKYPDLPDSIDPAKHYLAAGATEGRDPGPQFDSSQYLDTHADVLTSGTNPLVHYLRHGRGEGRATHWPDSEEPLIERLEKLTTSPHLSVQGSTDLKIENGQLVAMSKDPQIIIACLQPLRPGWYRVEAEVSGSIPGRPLIYFDDGSGFSEEAAVPLHYVERDRFSTLVHLPRSIRTLRFDPIDRPGVLTVVALSLRPMGTSSVLRAVTRAGSAILAGRNPVTAAREILSKSRSGQVVGFAPDSRWQTNEVAAYQRWIASFDYVPGQHRADYQNRVAVLDKKPLISILMPTYETPETMLREAIESVRNQIYPEWELCIADDASKSPHVKRVLEEYVSKDPRIKVIYRASNGHISEATNSACELASGEWIALLDHDDILREHALAEVVLGINQKPDVEVVYSDEDKLSTAGERFDPFFKPDFSPDLFRSQNYLNHLTVHRAQNICDVGGWRKGFEGSQDYDLNLRIIERVERHAVLHISKVLYHWRAVEGSTALANDQKGYAYQAGRMALEDHLRRVNLPAKVEGIGDFPFYRVVYPVPQPEPLVSLIIPTRDNVDVLRLCVESILEKTSYRKFEIIIVDNQSSEQKTREYLEQLSSSSEVRVIRYDQPFNYSAINNFAVTQAAGSIIGLLNNDLEVISPDWLREMVSHACRKEVGCVGAKLYYPNDTVQHGGVILGLGGVAEHAHKNFPRRSPGYFGRLQVCHNVSAVTGACLLVRREVYQQVGGLDEERLAIAFNDVDFCLKVREAGYLNVWTPFAELYHHESLTRGAEDTPEKRSRFVSEVNTMEERWGNCLRSDPYYSPNLTLEKQDFSLRLD